MATLPAPHAGRHRLLPSEREAFARAAGSGALPPGWVGVDAAASDLWCGPGLCVARRGASGFELIEGEAARRLLIEHGFRASADERRRADAAAAPGTPIPEAIRALARAFPEHRPIEVRPTGALFVRVPGAVLGCDGRLGTLDWILWYEGEEAIDTIFQFGMDRDGRTHESEPPSPPAAAQPSTDARPQSTAALRIPLAWSERQRLLRGLALAAACAGFSPVLALPLLLLDAVAWLIGIAALWALAIPLGGYWLRRAEERARRPCLELDGYLLRVPLRSLTRSVDLRQARIERSWQAPIPAAPKHGGTRPPEARLRLTSDGADILFVGVGLPQLPGFPLRSAPVGASTHILELLPGDFSALCAAIESGRR